MITGKQIRRRGFTMIEMIIVCVIMAMLMSGIVYRMTSRQGRNFDTTVEQVGDLLMMYALRSEHGRQPVGLMIDPERSALMLMRREGEVSSGNQPMWKMDPMVGGVQFPEFMDIGELEVRVDGDQADLIDWPLSAMPGQDRPLIEIELNYENRTVLLSLPPYALSPQRLEAGVQSTPARIPEDLDTTGRWQEDW